MAGDVRGQVVQRTGADRMDLEDQSAQRFPSIGLVKVPTCPYPAGPRGN